MKNYIKSIPLAAVLALALSSVSAQTTAPMGAASATTTIGVTPQEAAIATEKAVPRSDTATLVETAPSAVDKARSTLNDATTTTTTTNGNTATTVAPVRSTPSKRPMTTPRPARADRN